MKRLYFSKCLAVMVVSASLQGCALAQAEPTAERADTRTQAEVKFSKRKIRIAEKTIVVEIADTPAKRERGLMYRKDLPEDQGMLFIFETEAPRSFWMRNTLIPLSIGYFGNDQRLDEVLEMVPAPLGDQMPKSYPSREPARYALEMPKGWFDRNKVRPGATFSFDGKR